MPVNKDPREALSPRIRSHRTFISNHRMNPHWQELADAVGRDGEEAVLELLDHPKTKYTNVGDLVAATKHITAKSLVSLWGNPKADKRNINHLAEAAKSCGVDEIRKMMNHHKATTYNLFNLSQAATKCGLGEVWHLLDHKMSTPNNLVDFAAMAGAGDLEPAKMALEFAKRPTEAEPIARTLQEQVRVLTFNDPKKIHALQWKFIRHDHMPTTEGIKMLVKAKGHKWL